MRVFAERRNKSVGHLRWGGPLVELIQKGKYQPVLAHGKANARRFGAADGLAEAVVTAAAEQGILRA